jgi:hypothetical protein
MSLRLYFWMAGFGEPVEKPAKTPTLVLRVGVWRGYKSCYPDPYPSVPYP